MTRQRPPQFLVILAAALGLGGPSTRAQAPVEDEIARAIEKLTESATPLRKERATAEMVTLIADLRETHALDEASIERLKAAAERAVEDSLPLWSEDFSLFLTRQMERMAPRYYYNTANLLRQLRNERAASIVDRFQSVTRVRPESRESWTRVLAEVIGKEARDEWRAALAREDAEKQRAVSDFLDDYFREPFQKQKASGESVAADLAGTIGADDALKAKLVTLMTEAHQAHFRSQRSETGYVLERTLPERWTSFVGFFHSFDPENSDIWRQGLTSLLNPEQAQSWKTRVEKSREEEEAKFLNILAISEPNLRPQFQASMDRALEIVKTAAAPDEAVMTRLEAAAKAAVDASLAGWREEGLELFRSLPPETRENLIQSNRFQHGIRPEDDPALREPWREALSTLLSAEQQAAHQAETAKREEEERLQLAEMIDNTAETYTPQGEAQIDPKIADLINTLELDDERAAAFRKAGEAAVKETLDLWKERAREWLEQMSPEQRRNYTEQGHVPLGLGNEDTAENQPAWETAFHRILTEEEIEKWKRIQESRVRGRTDALANLLVAQMETWVGLTEEQWPPLARLSRKPAESLSSLFEQQHYYLGVQQIAQALRQVDDEALKEILTDGQHERWRESLALLDSRNRGTSREDLAQKQKESPPPPGPAPMYVEEAITEFLHERNRLYKQDLLLMAVAEIEVVGEAVGSGDDTIARLLTAAKGAVEETTNKWDANFSQYVRRRAQGANPRTIHQQLLGVGNYSSRQTAPLQTQLWQRALTLHLDPAGQTRWKEASSRREALRREAITGMVSSYFESRFGLNERQAPVFRKLLAASLETYSPDIEQIFTSHNSPWYLQYYSVGLPLMGVPEEELKSLLSEEQHEIWQTQYQSNAANYWDNVERYHEQRTQEEKKTKEKDS